MVFRELAPWRRGEMGTPKEPSHPLAHLQRDFERLMDDFKRSFRGGELEPMWGGAFPFVDVAESDKNIVVTAEIPGLDEKEIDVSLSGNTLFIRGEKKEEKEEKKGHFYRSERHYGMFQRNIPLPVEVKEDKVEATYKKGVLKITLPKSEEGQKARKKIEIH